MLVDREVVEIPNEYIGIITTAVIVKIFTNNLNYFQKTKFMLTMVDTLRLSS